MDGSSDEDMKEEYDIEQPNEGILSGGPNGASHLLGSGAGINGGSLTGGALGNLNEHYWREKERTVVNTKINAH